MSTLSKNGFKQSQADHCIYTKFEGDFILIVLLWVDDIIMGSNDTAGLISFKEHMKSTFKMTDLGEINWFLGITFVNSENSITMQ